MRTVFIDAGIHTVEFSYFPENFRNGLMLSGLSALVLIILVMISARRRLFRLDKDE